MATSQTVQPPPHDPQESPNKRTPFGNFWQRVSDGLEISELWKQFGSEARASYGLYSADVDWTSIAQKKGAGWAWAVFKAFFWAMVMKLSPARRVLLVIALITLLLGDFSFQFEHARARFDFGGLGVLILLVLLALELADRVTMKRDLEIAREIQSWLVPEAPPKVPGHDIAFATRPANTVAGDYYDAFFPHPNSSRLLLVVADVAGKSVPAALLMATFQASLHSSAAASGSLNDLVEHLNRFACERSLNGMRFTTAFFAELDVSNGSLTYVNAGHNAPVLRQVTGEFERLEKGGVPIGIDPASFYETGTARLGRGGLLLIFTDGLVETVNATAEEFGESRMLNALNAIPGESARETIRHLFAEADAFAGATRQHDDITCLAVRAALSDGESADHRMAH